MTTNHIKMNIANFPSAVALAVVISASLFSLSAFSDTPSPTRIYDRVEEEKKFAALKNIYGKKKKLPEGYELQTLIALSHYPELKETKINFIIDDVNIPLSSRPHWSSMLRSARNRTYSIIIDNSLAGVRDVLLLKNQPFNAQVGIIGHELSHTVYYLERSFWGILKDALCQLSSCRIEFERSTDHRLIEHGLGWQRLEHARFVRQRLGLPEHADNPTAEGSAYMSPNELIKLIDNHDAYKD